MGTLAARHIVVLRGTIVILLAAISNGIAQECRSPLNNRLVVAEENLIWTVDANGQNREALTTSLYPSSLAYDYTSNTLYWSDWKKGQIFALRDKSSKPRIATSPAKTWLPDGLDIDSVTGKIYFAEPLSSSVRVSDLKTNYQAIILSTNMTEVNDVELDLEAGYMFILDKFQIIRTDLDGSNLKVIYAEPTSLGDILKELPPFPTGVKKRSVESDPEDLDLTETFNRPLRIADVILDQKTKRVFWVDTMSRRIESMDYEGNGRLVHFQDLNAPKELNGRSSLAFIDRTLYYANRETKRIYKIDLNGNKHNVILENVEPLAIKGISCSNQQIATNPCENNNGGCQQLCLLSKTGKNNYKCACSIGYELGKDGKTCNSVQEFLLYAQYNLLRGQRLDTDGITFVDVINPSQFQLGSYSNLDYDAEDGLVFYTSSFPSDKLHQIRLDTSEQTTFEPDVLSKNVGNVAYDWVSKNLYYLTYYYADYTTLSVVNVRNPTYSKIVIDSVKRLVRDIVVHPNRGYVFLAQAYDNGAYINRLATDGSDLTEIVKLNGVIIDGLAIDYDEDRIYWTESWQKTKREWESRIRSSNLDGQDIKDIPIPKGLQRPTELSIQGNYIYVIFGQGQSIVRLNKRQSNEAVNLGESEQKGEIADIKVFSRKIQTTRSDHPCAANHGCQKFCFALPSSNGNLKGICGCPYGEKLAADGKSCVDNSKGEPPFLPCKHTSFKCNVQKQTV